MDATRFFRAFSVNFPYLVLFVTSFSSVLIKAHKQKLRLAFLRRCMDEQVLPRSILPRRVLNFADRPFEEYQRLILQKHIDICQIEVKEAFRELRRRKYSFIQAIPFEWKNVLFDYCYGKLRMCCRRLENKLHNKLNRLIRNSDWSRNSNPNFVVNLSNKPLDNDTKCALGYGLNFGISNRYVDCVDIAKSFTNLEKYGDIANDDINMCKGIVYGCMAKSFYLNVPLRFMVAYQNLKKDNDLHITKGDKANVVVVMNRVDYVSKITDLLNDRQTYEKLRSDPLHNVNSNFNKKLKLILNGQNDLIKKFSSQCPRLPYLYGLVKTHKPNNPIRPIVSSVGSVCYKLSKWLVKVLTPLVGNISGTSILNNVDFVNRLCSLNINFEFKMVSFDVVSLFTKVPVDDLLDFLKDELENFDMPISPSKILDLIKLCIKDCKFSFDSNFYKQKFGMAMGNPLSPVLSNLYMEFFEAKILSRILPRNIYWFRYVDDIFCIWPKSENLQNFLAALNNLVPSIRFTLEEEENCILPFLDVCVHRDFRSFKFDIFRKPTNICSYIHFYSNHETKIKKSVFSGMFLRALRICSPEFMENEIQKIYEIAVNLKYPNYLIDSALRAARKIFYSNDDKIPFSTKNILSLPFHINFNGIPRILKMFGVNVVFRYCNIKSFIIKNSPGDELGCIYKVPCNVCNKQYIGQTGKDLSVRLKQHKYSVRTAQESNALFIHLSVFNHTIDWDGARELVRCSDIVKRNLIESCFIKFYNDTVLNISPGLFKLDSFIINEIVRYFKRETG